MSALTIFFWIICVCIAIVAITNATLFVIASIQEIKRTIHRNSKGE